MSAYISGADLCLPRYSKKGFIRARNLEVSLNAKGSKGRSRYQLRISNLREKDLTEVDYSRHDWETIFDKHPLKIRIRKDGELLVVILKGDLIGVLAGYDIKYFKARLYQSWSAWGKFNRGLKNNSTKLVIRDSER